MRARYSESAHDGDLPDALVHRDSYERRHEKKADEEAHCPKYQRELAEIAESLIDLRERGLDRQRAHIRDFSLCPLAHALDPCIVPDLDHEE